ncbi:helix-turn-helix domain-containing protein [Cohnella sp. GCM10027633]|uniref:helix-turn-helix domain-containing protein n=1 Tax=unclassified Cohnella TaxID=2636738 RepID=UPI0036278CE2
MSWLRTYQSRKYWQSIIRTISLLMVLFLLVSSAVLYYSAESLMLKATRQSNRQVMDQLNNELGHMNEIIKNLATSLYYRNDTKVLMNSRTPDMLDILNKQAELDYLVHSSAYLHSILIYNGNLDKFIYGSKSNGTHEQLLKDVRLFLQQPEQVRKMRLTPLTGGVTNEDAAGSSNPYVVSYFMYESLKGYSSGDSVLILNIKPQWLFDNMNKINISDVHQNKQVYLVDNKGEAIYSAQSRLPESVKQEIWKRVHDGDTFNSFTYHGAGPDQIVTYLETGINQWVIVSVQPYSEILGNIHHLRNTTVIVTVIFLLLSLVFSLIVSHKLYRPVHGLVGEFRHNAEGAAELQKGQDEFQIIASVHSRAIANVKRMRQEQDAKRNIVHNYYSRTLLADGPATMNDEWQDYLREQPFLTSERERLAVCVLRIDDYRAFEERPSHADQELIRFAIGNIASEIIGREYPNLIVEFRGDQGAAIVGIPRSSAGGGYAALPDLLSEMQRTVWSYFRVSVTVALSGLAEHWRDLPKAYAQAQQVAKYRLTIGKMSVILPSDVARNEANDDFQLPPELKKKLAAAIKSSQTGEPLEELLGQIRGYLQTLSEDNMIHSLLDTVALVKTTLHEINANRLQPVDIDLTTFIRTMLDRDTLHEMTALLRELLADIMSRQQVMPESKNRILIETIKEIVGESYYDPNLNLQSIALVLKMSPVYIGRVFKQTENVPLTEYINDVRLNRSLDLLENKHYSINTVMEKVGYINQSYFFRLFKKKFGTTPKEYRIKKAID